MTTKKQETSEDATPAIDIAAIVNAAVTAALNAKSGAEDLAATLGGSIKDAIEAANPRPMTPGKRRELGYGRTPFDAPKGKVKRLNHYFYQNKCELRIPTLSFDECETLNRIAELPNGKYCNGFITLAKEENGDGRLKVWIGYPYETADDKLREKNIGANFTQFLNAILLDAKAQKAARLAMMRAEVEEANQVEAAALGQ